MADREWVSSDGNWGTAASWAPAAVPLDGERVYFTGTSQVDVTAGLTLGASNDAFVELNISGYTGSIGSIGNPLITDAITTLRFASNGGKLFIDSDGATITDVIVESQRGLSDMLFLDGVITNLNIIRCAGKVTVAAGATVTNMNMIASPSCTLVTTAGVSGLALCRFDSGTWESNAAISTGVGHVLQFGGTLKHTIGAITLLEILDGGQFIHTASETIVALIGSGPKTRFDGRLNKNLPSIEITDASGYDGFQFLLKNDLNSYIMGVSGSGYQDFTGRSTFETGLGITKK